MDPEPDTDSEAAASDATAGSSQDNSPRVGAFSPAQSVSLEARLPPQMHPFAILLLYLYVSSIIVYSCGLWL